MHIHKSDEAQTCLTVAYLHFHTPPILPSAPGTSHPGLLAAPHTGPVRAGPPAQIAHPIIQVSAQTSPILTGLP